MPSTYGAGGDFGRSNDRACKTLMFIANITLGSRARSCEAWREEFRPSTSASA
jgi:hypothetical protein